MFYLNVGDDTGKAGADQPRHPGPRKDLKDKRTPSRVKGLICRCKGRITRERLGKGRINMNLLEHAGYMGAPAGMGKEALAPP